MGKERIHFEAPAAKKLDLEMGAFLDWLNGNTEGDWVVKAGMAHLWFVTIHPFEDGNGRMREPSPIWRSHDPNKVRNASTACRPRSGKSVPTTMTF
jgi:hypothetical protein